MLIRHNSLDLFQLNKHISEIVNQLFGVDVERGARAVLRSSKEDYEKELKEL
jgi:hypothetical protein